MRRLAVVLVFVLCIAAIGFSAHAALVEPPEVKQPGTQPQEAPKLESADRCDNCHGGYNRAVEPAFNWRGSMMANATRDPLFWATLAIAEQGFDGSGDFCIRCHTPSGWYGGRSTPTDGSALRSSDADGVDCDSCHMMANPNQLEISSVMNPPFVANDGQGNGYYGSGMLALHDGNAKLGPYSDAGAKHQFLQSLFHRDVNFCGSCHDVSNPVVGDLAHNFGVPPTAGKVIASGSPGYPLEDKAAFNNFPFQYGIVERTFSEHMASALPVTRVSSYGNLPAELQDGAIKAAYESARGDYQDGAYRFFSCQTCHMRAVTGYGANKKGIPLREDLPLHDMTGGNYWTPDAILYQNARNTLRLGGGLTSEQIAAIEAGKLRAQQQLELAASLSLSGNRLRINNLTGHKLISGYPEGRRMWLNIRWYNDSNELLREDGKYDAVAEIQGVSVRSLVDLYGANTKIYEAHHGLTQEWATQLLGLGYDASMPLSYDRVTGAVSYTLGQLAAQESGTAYKTFHFVLNNTVMMDNRIPPYGFAYDAAWERNALPVPATQYGDPGVGRTYNYWDELVLVPPDGAVYAEIRLLYQPTSWEYVQFLYLANDKQNAFLAQEGDNLLEAWLNTGQAEPYTMASITWGSEPKPPESACEVPGVPTNLVATGGKRSVSLTWQAGTPAPTGGYRIYYDQAGKLQFVAAVGPGTFAFTQNRLSRGMTYCYGVTAWNDCNGDGIFDPGMDLESAISNKACGTAE
jgi:hypothetical protein